MKRKSSVAVGLTLMLFALLPPAHAAPLYFDAEGGAKIWDDGTTANWANSPSDSYDTVWSSGSDAHFEGTAGTVNVSGTIASVNAIAFDVAGYTLSGGTITMTGASQIGGQDATIGSILAGSVGLIKTAAGTLTLTGANTFGGTLTVEDGTLSINHWTTDNTNGRLGNSNTKVVLGRAGTTGTLQYTGPRIFSGNLRGIQVDDDRNGKVHLLLSGSENDRFIHIAGSRLDIRGSLTIDTYDGVTVPDGDTVRRRFIVTAPAGISFTGNLTVAQHSELQLSAPSDSPFTFGSGTVTVNEDGILNLWRSGAATVTLGGLAGDGLVRGDTGGLKTYRVGSNHSDTEFSGVIANGRGGATVAVTKVGDGELTLSGNNTFSGALGVVEGTLSIGTWHTNNTDGPLGNSNTRVVLGGAGTMGTLEFTATGGYGTARRGIELAEGGTGMVHLTPATGTRSNNYIHIDGSNITGNGAFVVDTSHGATQTSRFIIVGNTGISGPITVNPYSELQNNLASTGDNTPFGTGTITVHQNGILNIFRNNTDGTAILGGLAGAGTVHGEHTGTKTFKIGANHESTEFSGVIQNNSATHVALTKIGEGTLTLSGTNTFTGATNVEKGTLLVNGSLTGTSGVTVHDGATLGGTGSIAAAVAGEGWISPGNSAGILTVDSIDPSGGLNARFEFGKTESPNYSDAADSGNDVLRITRQAPITGPLTSDNLIDIYFGVAPSLGDVFRGGVYVDVAGDPQGLTDFYDAVAAATYNYYVHDGGGYVPFSQYAPEWWSVAVSTVAEAATFGGGAPVSGGVMQFTLVPEPGTWLMLLSTVAFALLVRRRRK